MLGFIDEAARRRIERDFIEADSQSKLGNLKQAEMLRGDCHKLLRADYKIRREQAREMGLE